jgi:phosphoribosyl-AMP cyclohydrolase
MSRDSAAGWLQEIQWDTDGLVPAIVQDAASDRLLMLAWMNRESLALTVARGEAVYWSRSRRRLWHKGEQSGHVQKVQEVRLDCDGDAVLLRVEQVGGIACHTGRERCFYRRLQAGEWVQTDPVLKDPAAIYHPSRGGNQP